MEPIHRQEVSLELLLAFQLRHASASTLAEVAAMAAAAVVVVVVALHSMACSCWPLPHY
jgi:hypothetical protein